MSITEHVTSKIFFSKSDLMSAFSILLVLPIQRRLLIMKCKCPGTNKMMFFVEKCLPFGSSISCATFQLFSDSLKALIEFATQRYEQMVNYLDYYLFISSSEEECNHLVRSFIELCQEIGCPVSLNKTEWAANFMVFLSILMNGSNSTLTIPEENRKSLGPDSLGY